MPEVLALQIRLAGKLGVVVPGNEVGILFSVLKLNSSFRKMRHTCTPDSESEKEEMCPFPCFRYF